MNKQNFIKYDPNTSVLYKYDIELSKDDGLGFGNRVAMTQAEADAFISNMETDGYMVITEQQIQELTDSELIELYLSI